MESTNYTSGQSQLSPVSRHTELGSAARTLVVPTDDADERKGSRSSLKANITNALMYGIINSVLAIPGIYGYALIIFSHQDFTDFMPALSKLVIFSCVVHQVMFTLMSSLPFAIGQVQDAGLIFLSVMTTSICNSLGDDVSLEAKVTTSIVIIGVATASMGVCLIAMGKLKLANLASYLPLPVIGGYLAFIGIFWLYAGLALCTGLVINNVESMINVFNNAHDVLLCVPGVLGGAFFLVVSQRYDNSFILSAAIMGMPIVFYAILLAGGISMDDARDGGWVSPSQDPAKVTQLLDLFDFSQVHWEQLPRLFSTWIGMVFIVAVSSCLDIAAIDIDMGGNLDFNHELKIVGWSNVVSGLLGGYTGSYIFSQTIFTCRSKTNSRLVGLCVALSEFSIVIAPVSVMSYVPRFFFAATVIFISIDLIIEWLVLTYWKMSLREYAVLWMTFVAVNLVSLDVGMLIGIGVAIVNFLLGYVRLPVVKRKSYSSSTADSRAERGVLGQKRDTIAHFELRGFLFFGSSVQILDGVQKGIYVRKNHSSGELLAEVRDEQGQSIVAHPVVLPTLDATLEACVECLDGSPAPYPEPKPTEYVVMDFTSVTAIDVTVARSAFLILQNYCMSHGIALVYGAALPEIQELLLKNGIVDKDIFFETAEAALEFCESGPLTNTNV